MKESTMRSIIAATSASVMTLLLASCDVPEIPASGTANDQSMTEIESCYHYRIYVHNPTGVHYIVYRAGNGDSAFTVMLNSDGTPYTGS